MLQELYNLAPACIQNFMCSAQGLVIKKRRYNRQFFRELNLLEGNGYNQSVELVKMLHSISEMPVYASYLSDIDFKILADNPNKVYEILSHFPILDKATVRRNIENYTNTKYRGKKILMHTSGTTGSGLIFPYSVEMENKQWAVWWRYRRGLGINFDTWCGWFGGRIIMPLVCKKAPFWRINRPGKQVMYSSYHLTIETAYDYYEDIKNRQLTWLHGYPSSIARLSSLFIDSGFQPLSCVRFITTGAENLMDHQVSLMERAFPNAIVRQHYGLSEGVANFSQDIEGKWYADDDFCYVELIPLNEEDPSLCRIIGTGFSNEAFILVRYDTGDLANVEWVDGKPVIISFDGRKDDYITLPNGVKLGRLGFIFKHSVNIKEAQIHQHTLDDIEIKVVKGDAYSKSDENQLLKEAQDRFGSDVNVRISYVDKIERTKSGKLRLVKSDIV